MKVLSIGAARLPEGYQPGTTPDTQPTFDGSERVVADPTYGGGSYPTPPAPTSSQYADPNRYAQAMQAAPQPMEPYYPPSAPSGDPGAPQPPAPQPQAIVCPSGYAFDTRTNQCVPASVQTAPSPRGSDSGTTPGTVSPGYPTPQPYPTPYPTTPAIPVAPGYFSLFGRAYPIKWLWIAGGSISFGLILLAILAGRRRKLAA